MESITKWPPLLLQLRRQLKYGVYYKMTADYMWALLFFLTWIDEDFLFRPRCWFMVAKNKKNTITKENRILEAISGRRGGEGTNTQEETTAEKSRTL